MEGSIVAGPWKSVPVPSAVGLSVVLPPMLNGWPGPLASSGCPLKASPLPVYISGAAPAVVSRSHTTTCEPGVAPGTMRQNLPV